MWANIIQKKYVFDNTSLFNVQNNDENEIEESLTYLIVKTMNPKRKFCKVSKTVFK